MTLVDSLDSILMFYSYTGFAGHSWRIFEPSDSPARTRDTPSVNTRYGVSLTPEIRPVSANEAVIVEQSRDAIESEIKAMNNVGHDGDGSAAGQEHEGRMVLVKRSTMSELGIILTTLSILLAFRSVNEVTAWRPTRLLISHRSISLIEILGLIGANCGKCQAGATAPGGGGLAGAWWRAWAQVSRTGHGVVILTERGAQANENYGYIGAAIVGVFVFLVGGWYTFRMIF